MNNNTSNEAKPVTSLQNSQETASVRQVKPSNLSVHSKQSILKSNVKGMMAAEVAAAAKRTNYGHRQQHRNQNYNHQLNPPSSQPHQASASNQQITQQQSTTQTASRSYASTKPAQKRATGGQRTKGESSLNLDQSYRQMRAQSRRNVPSHLFHPAAPHSQDVAESPTKHDTAAQKHQKFNQQSSQSNIVHANQQQQYQQHHYNETAFGVGSLANDAWIGDSGFDPAAVIAQGFHKPPASSTVQATAGPKQKAAQNATIQIRRDNIQPPLTQQQTQAQNQSQQQPGGTVKRRSVITQQRVAVNQHSQTAAATIASQQQNKTTASRKQSSTIVHDDDLHSHQHFPTNKRRPQETTLDALVSLETLTAPTGPGQPLMDQYQNHPAQQRKNSSLSRRDQQIHMHHLQQQQFQNAAAGHKRRKSSSNPRQKMSSNMRTLQVAQNAQPPSQEVAGRVRVQRTVRDGRAKLGQKYGYKYGGGPLEAYSTTGPHGTLQPGHHQPPSHQIFTSLEGPRGAAMNPNPGVSKKLSANQIPQTIQISQDINPMHLQHLSSIDRTASIDSACYDFSQIQQQHQYQQNSKTYQASGRNPGSTGVTPKTGKASETSTLQSRDNTLKMNPIAPGFSEMLKQTILSKAQENQKRNSLKAGPLPSQEYPLVDPGLEAALLSLDQSQLTQNVMRELMDARMHGGQGGLAEAQNRKASYPNSAKEGGVMLNDPSAATSSRLESLIQQLIVRKEITQSPNIQQRRAYNTGQTRAAHNSMQVAHQLVPDSAAFAGGQSAAHRVSNFASSLHGGEVLKQEHSAEDLLRIGRKDESAATMRSPKRGTDERIVIHENSQLQNRAQQLIPKPIRPGHPESNAQGQADLASQQHAASFGQINTLQENVPGPATLNQPRNGNRVGINLSDTFGLPNPGQTQRVGAFTNAGQAFPSTVSNSVSHEAATGVSDIHPRPSVGEAHQTMQTLGDNSSIIGDFNAVDRQKFLSLEQPQLPNAKTALGSDGSLEDVYHKTLNAYQNDMNQLNEINRTRKEISNRLMRHQNILQSIQGATKFGADGAPSQASGVLMDSVANASTQQQLQSSVIGAGGDGMIISDQGHNLHALLGLQGPQPQQQMGLHQQPLAISQGPMHPAGNYSTVTGDNVRNHRGSFADAGAAGNTSLDHGKQSQYISTSPIVGRYRLKHATAVGTLPTSTGNKRQQAYEGTQQMRQGINDKRTKSVRPRRPNGQQLGGGPTLRGGRRGVREEQKMQTMAAVVRNKFDPIAQAYNSATSAAGRDDYIASSQRSIGGLGSLTAGPQNAGGGAAQQQVTIGAGPTANPTSQQLISITAANKRQMQTIDAQKSAALQQTYGVAQKLTAPTAQQSSSVKRSTGASVPRQRQGTSGFSSIMRPPIKQTERSLSLNRNRAQHSFQQTNSFVAQHTYLSNGSGSIGSQQQAVGTLQQLHGSAQYPSMTNPANMSGTYIEGAKDSTFEMQSSVSPINSQQKRTFKHRAKMVAPAAKQRAGKNKSTSRGRGAIVASSTQIVGPAARKQSRIIAQGIPSRETKQTQLSQQQVYQFRGSLLQHQAQPGADQNNSIRISSGAQSRENQLVDSRLSPDRKTVERTFETQEDGGTPDALQVVSEQQSPLQQHKLKLLNKITRKKPSPRQTQRLQAAARDDDEVANEMSVGGQEIGGPMAQTAQVQPFMRTHNLRYSSAANDFCSLPNESGSPILEEKQQAAPAAKATGSRGALNRSELSQETQERQNQAMKLINEDNPFENPSTIKETLPHATVVMLSNAAIKTASDGPGNQKIMSLVGDASTSKQSMAEKTTDRESKNTNATGGFGVSSSAAASATLTNHFTFSKQSQHRRVNIGGGGQPGNTGGGNPVGLGVPARRSLLGVGAMRRSETTEDSQQCMYNDGTLIMSSLPMPMQSIKQVIAEEEAADEQDERTTNKESNKLTGGKASGSGNRPSSGTDQDAANAKGGEVRKNTASGNQSSSNRDELCIGDTPKISSSDNQTTTRKISDEEGKSSKAGGPAQRGSPEASIKDEIEQRTQSDILDPADSVCQGEDSQNDNLVLMAETPNNHHQKSARADFIKDRPQSQKQSDRYSARHRHSESGANMLCESEGSVQQLEDSGVIGDDAITPDILLTKKDLKATKGQDTTTATQQQQRRSYNRGQFQQASASKLLADFPPPLSESSVSRQSAKQRGGSDDSHSDDEIEVRRGLESEHVRTDMGSNPELLRQSTHSLLHKPTKAKEDAEQFGEEIAADLLVLKKPTKHGDESNDNLILDEINVDLSRDKKSHNQLPEQQQQITLQKPSQQARNNNYFTEGNAGSNPNSAKKFVSNKIKSLKVEQTDDEEEEEGIVGQVDAEEFKLGKII